MSTRAMYTFRSADGSEEFHVYKHQDGYPTGAAEALVAALEYAWPLPRYEADEFAAAFVAANKSHSGGVRLMPSGKFEDVAPYDLEYRYIIQPRQGHVGASTQLDAHLLVHAFSVHHQGAHEYVESTDKSGRCIYKAKKVLKARQGWKETKLFTAPLKSGDTLKAKAKAWQDARNIEALRRGVVVV